jgi:hypothetical protein
LLFEAALSWFALLLEKNSPHLEDLDNFLTKFSDTFSKTDKVQTAIIKLRSLRQGSCLTSVYAVDFRQLACDVDWDDNTLISVFHWGLRDNIKDLFLNFPDPLKLTEAITQAVRGDNQLFECRQKQRSTQGHIKLKPLLHGNKHQLMDQSLSQCKSILQTSKNCRKRRKTDNVKKAYACIVTEKINKLENAL